MRPVLVIVTGLSGAGKTTALKALEDLGFFCVDNLPPPLIPRFLDLLSSSSPLHDRVAVVVDVRAGEFLDNLTEVLAKAKKAFELLILFLDAGTETLINRFKVARRVHPFGPGVPLDEAIARERKILFPLREMAKFVVDTTGMNVHQLRERIQGLLSSYVEKEFVLYFVSFSYSFGIPYDANLVFDVRFMPNPYFVDELKKLSGEDKRVKDFLLSHEEVRVFLKDVEGMIDFLVPSYKKQMGYMVVAFGCTGGFHRSVFTAEYFYDIYIKKGITAKKVHREKERIW